MSNFPKHSSLSLEELGRDVTTGITADKWRKPSTGPQAPSSDALPEPGVGHSTETAVAIHCTHSPGRQTGGTARALNARGMQCKLARVDGM